MGDECFPKVVHLDQLSDRMRSLLFNGDHSDIIFIAENERVPAHTFVLNASCDLIRARLLEKPMKKGEKKEIVLPSVSVESLRQVLSYIYTGRLSLGAMKLETIVGLLKLSYDFRIKKLGDAVFRYLRQVLSVENAGTIYDMALSLGVERLSRCSLDWIDKNADAFLESKAIAQLSSRCMREILRRDSFCAEEMKILEAVKRWAADRLDDKEVSSVTETIRVTLFSETQLLNIAKESRLIPADRLQDVLAWKQANRDVDQPYRGSWVPEVNLATTYRGAKVLAGEHKDSLLEPKIVSSELGQTTTNHGFGDPRGITVEFREAYKINHIVLRLLDKGSYCVEVSKNFDDWHRVIDYSNYCCRSLQKLYFEPRVCRYIRVVGTLRSRNESFNLVSIEAMFTEKPFKLRQGIVLPESNVASLKMGACVIQGDNGLQNDSRCQDMINGDWQNYDWGSGFTQHTINNGCIIVQLAQPYIIDSIRMLLWCLHSFKYSYYIETSTDMKQWTRVVDRTRESCRSWQLLRFEARTVIFIKIVGTASSVAWFHVVHFECPVQKEEEKEQEEEGEEEYQYFSD